MKQKSVLLQIQRKIIDECPQLKEKRQIVRYYVSLDIKRDRSKIINWWESMIELAIQKSGQLFLSPAELEIIFTLHGLKPVPLRAVLKFICNSKNQFQWRDRDMLNQQEHQVTPKSAIKTIVSYVFSIKDKNLNLSTYKDLQDQTSSKIISLSFLKRKISQANDLFINQFGYQKNMSYQYIVMKLKNYLFLADKSVQILLQQLINKQDILIETVAGKRVVFFTDQIKESKDKKWLEIEKQKFQLKSKINDFNKKIEQKTKQEQGKLQQAKKVVQTNKEKAKTILVQVKNIRTSINGLNERVKVLKKSLDDLEMNEANTAVIDAMENAQHVLKTAMKDPAMLQSIIQANQQVKLNQKEMNDKFDELNSFGNDDEDDIKDQVNNLMAQLQRDIKQKKWKKEGGQSATKFVSSEAVVQVQETYKRPPDILFRDAQFN